RHAHHNVADFQGRVEAACGAGADHGANGRGPIDQVLRLHGMLGFAVAADGDEDAELLEALTLLKADVDARPGVTGRSEGTGDALQLEGLGNRDEGLRAFHIGLARSSRSPALRTVRGTPVISPETTIRRVIRLTGVPRSGLQHRHPRTRPSLA